jgi:hypothetical protein
MCVSSYVTLCVSPADATTSKWLVGVRGGFNDAKFIGDPVGAMINIPGLAVSGQVDGWQEGFVAGVFVRHNGSENVGLQVELNFSQKGGEGPVTGVADVHYPGDVIRTADINGVISVEMDYVELPVFAVFSFQTDASDKTTVTASVGGYVAYNTAAWAKVEGTASVLLPDGSTQVSNFDQKWGLGNIVNRWDAGGLLGLGLEVALERVDLLFDFRWTFGFLSIDDTDRNSSIRNNVISLTFGIGVPLGSELPAAE